MTLQSENGFPTQEKINSMLQRHQIQQRFVRNVVKLVLGVIFLYIAYWVLTNSLAFLRFIVSLLFWLNIIMELHRTQTGLMTLFWMMIGMMLLVIYLLPYRLVRKSLRIADRGQFKDIGRVVFIKGGDEDSNPQPSIVYQMWYSWRFLMHRIRRKKTKRTWMEARPTPHEIPIGDVNYLRGRPTKNIQHFRYAILFKSNIDGIIGRHFHPRWLYLSPLARIETRAFVHNVIGEGFITEEYPQYDLSSTRHYELRMDRLQFHDRPIQPYLRSVEEQFERAAGWVNRGVESDAELAKDSVREFLQIAPSSYYLSSGMEIGKEGQLKEPPKLAPKSKETEQEKPQKKSKSKSKQR